MFNINWRPVLTGPQLHRAANAATSGQPEALPWFLYDTVDITNASVAHNFFQTVQNDKTLGNMESAGQLPDPQYFVLHYITCDLLVPPSIGDQAAAAVGALKDIGLVLKTGRATFTLVLANKNYGPFPLTLCHSTGGETGGGWGTLAASNSVMYANNGIPGSGGFPFTGALVIPPKTAFSLSVNLAAAVAVQATLKCRIGFAGVLYRRVV